jgi:hypothetical protein
MHTRFGPLADPARDGRPAPDAYWVLPGRLAGGPHPLGDFGDPGVLEAFDVFVNLTTQHHPSSGDAALPAYDDLVAAAGGSVVYRSIPDVSVPFPADCTETLDAIDGAIAAGHRVYVHCFGGRGRTGTILGCWLVRHGVPHAEVLGTIDLLRDGLDGPSPETEAQVAFVTGWAG